MQQLNIRIFVNTTTRVNLLKILTFVDNELDDPFPTVQVRTGTGPKGRPIYQDAREYVKEAAYAEHPTV